MVAVPAFILVEPVITSGPVLIFIMISLFIAIFNLLPIPLLDRGHIVYFILRSFFGNNLPESLRGKGGFGSTGK